MDTGSLEYNVIVVKWGDKFTAEHVNRIYRMAKRNLTLPFNFYCYTEDPTDIYNEVNIIPLDESLDLKAWWWKLTLFKQNDWSEGINLFLDLDIVIQKNIDHFFNKAKKNKVTIISDDYDWDNNSLRDTNPITMPEYNSSIMIWYNNENTEIYNKFIKDTKLYQNVYLGIDRFFTYEIDQNKFAEIEVEEYYFRKSIGHFEKVEDKISSAISFPKLNNDGKRIGTRSFRVFFDPNKSICVFNGCHEDYFYQGMEKYLV